MSETLVSTPSLLTGSELVSIRKSWGMSQGEFARELGYTIKSIANMEHDRLRISEHFIKHLFAVKKLREIRKIMDST